MKLTFTKCIVLAAFCAVMASCLPEMEYMYTDTGMCTLLAPDKLQTDGGDIYHISQNNAGANIPDTLKRVMTRCDVMSPVEGRANEYYVRLMEFASAIVEDPVLKSDMDETVVGNNGLNISSGWISGGYLNAYVFIPMLRPTKVNHTINLVFDDIRSNADTLYFEMRHNALGECPENPDIPLTSFEFAGTYTSFPLEGILESGKKPICHIEWDWYEGDEYSFTRNKIRRSGNLSIQ